MINADMRTYDYFTFGERDSYGQAQLSAEPAGTIKMAVYTTSQAIQDNINYKSANYIGLTNASINDKFVIAFGEEKLKVMYVQPKGKYKQVYLVKI